MINFRAKLVKPGVILVGFVSLVTQIILLREFLTFFNGNELVIGIILANWMLLTGFGAYIGRFLCKRKLFWEYTLLGSLAFLPTITVLLLHILWHLLFPPGIMTGISHVFWYSLMILVPFCLTSGILFTVFANEESLRSGRNKIGDVYAWESIGSLFGGILLNFLLIWIFTTFQSLFLLMLVLTILTTILSVKGKQYFTAGIIVFVALGFSFLFLGNNLDLRVRELAFPGQTVEYINETPYGIFTITGQDEQINYYENNVLLAASGDIISKEESVHFGMIQHPIPENILVLSGIVSELLNELLKYPVKIIDYVDINPEVIKIAKENFSDSLQGELNIIKGDAFRFLKKCDKKYDVVLINLPEPSTINLNRFYTQEFFQLLKNNLEKGAVISLSIPSSVNYMNNEAKRMLSIIYKTLQTEFNNVIILPASEDYLLASDRQLTINIAEKIEKRKIPTEYMNNYYIDDNLLAARSRQIIGELDSGVPVNKNFSPVFYQSQIKLWMSHFKFQYWIPAILILLFSGFFFIKAGAIYKGVFAAGFAGASIEIVLILVFQIVFGYVYATVGIFIMVFMGGLAYGSYYLPRFFKTIDQRLFRKMQMGVSVFAFILPVVFFTISCIEISDIILFILFTVLLLIISVLTGGIFSVASKISGNNFGRIASSAYGLDLLGAATGALLFTIYLIPVLGFTWSIFIVGGFNLAVRIKKV